MSISILFKSPTPIRSKNLHGYCRSLGHNGGWNGGSTGLWIGNECSSKNLGEIGAFFSFSVDDWEDGWYDFIINVTLLDDAHVVVTAQVVVQNRNPVLLVLGIACFVIAAITFVVQVRKSKRRSAVAFATARVPGAGGPGGMPQALSYRGPPPPRGGRMFATATKAQPKMHPQDLTRLAWKAGWKTWVPLAGLVGIFLVLAAAWAQAPPADIALLFGAIFAPPVPALLLVTGLALAGVAFLAWRTAAGKALGAILHVLVVIGAIYALAQVLLAESAVPGFAIDPTTLASVLLVISTTMLSWLAAPPPAAVLALRFARWGRVPGVPRGSPYH